MTGDRKEELHVIPGSVPSGETFQGCRFADRCGFAEECCYAQEPPLLEADKNRKVKCLLYPEASGG
jgi:oligopeptide/dipeptide ABC transporter ATP-binding protein